MPFGQHQDTELWNNQFPETKILGLPVSRRMRSLVYMASRDKVDVDSKEAFCLRMLRGALLMRKTAGMRWAEKQCNGDQQWSFFFLRFITQMKASKNRNMFAQCVKRSRN